MKIDFKKILGFIKENPISALALPLFASAVNFFTALIDSLKDGTIDSKELHILTASSAGVETMLIGILMLIIKLRD